MRLNLEIAGIVAFALALLSAIALGARSHSGALGAALAHGLVAGFGSVAWLVPVLVAVLGAIVFLEINVPRMIATLGFASFCYFAIIDAFHGKGIAESLDCLVKGDAMIAPIGGRLVVVPFKFRQHFTTDYP